VGVEKAGDVARERAVRDDKLSGIDGDTDLRNVFRVGSNSVIAVTSAARPFFHRQRKSIWDLAVSQKCTIRRRGG
jgi:hypothetical protein